MYYIAHVLLHSSLKFLTIQSCSKIDHHSLLQTDLIIYLIIIIPNSFYNYCFQKLSSLKGIWRVSSYTFLFF